MERVFDNFRIELLNENRGEAFYNLIDKNRVRLEDFFAGTVSRTQTLKDTLDYCVEIQNRIKAVSYLPYIIIDTNTHEFIGLIDVKNIDLNIPKAELGYFIDKDYAGYGIVSKALTKVIEYIIDTHGFKKLLCRIGSKNQASINVAIKNGFELEGTIRRDYKTTKGEIVDLNYYGRIF